MAFCGQEGAMLRIPWNNLRTTQSNLLRSQHLKEGGCHPCDVPQFEPCTWRQSRGMAYTLSHWPLEFKDAMNVGIQDASRAMKTSAGHGQKFGLRSEGRRFACLAEKRFREERKRWVCSVEPRKLMIGGSFPAAWNMPIHTVNVNVGWCKPWMKRQITFCWLQVIGWASMSTWDFTRRLANVQPPTWVGYWRGERWMKKLAPMGFQIEQQICCRRLSDGSRCFDGAHET